jgi:hypothetical protein
MRAKSASTTIADPYRAALSLGRSLAEIAPEIVFLFVTVNYRDWSEFMDGLYDGLGDPTVRVVGSSGDGFYETALVSDVGAGALGLAGDGDIAWHIASGAQAIADPEGAMRRALARLAHDLDGRQPAFYFMVADANVDGSRIEAIVHNEVPVPVIGGLAGDDNSETACGFVIMDRALLRDAVVLLAVDGPLPFQVHTGNSVSPIGSPGVVEGACGRTLESIDGVDAVTFVERQTGKSILRSDQGIALTLLNPKDIGERKLRAIAQKETWETGMLTLYGGVDSGDLVQVCITKPDDLEGEVKGIAQRAVACDFTASAGLIVSCAGRKWLQGGRIGYEVRAIADAFHRELPIAGFPSFGEIGPRLVDRRQDRNRYTPSLFHNMTYILLLLGS